VDCEARAKLQVGGEVMQEEFVNKATWFLLEAARAVNRKSAHLDKMIKKLQEDIEELEGVADQTFDELSNHFRDEIFKLHNVIQDSGGAEEAKPTDLANDIMSKYFYDQDETGIDECMIKLQEQLGLIKKEPE
jgi:hypothetical protein